MASASGAGAERKEGKIAEVEEDEEQEDVVSFKVIVLGDGAVGKTSLCTRFCDDSFDKQYKQTIGLDFFSRTLQLPNNSRAALQVWDIGGQSIGSKMISNYIFGAHGVLLVYDVTNYQSFLDLQDWAALVARTFAKEPKAPPLYLVANKMDLVHMQAVSSAKHDELAESLKVAGSFFLSAKTADGVDRAFLRLAGELAGLQMTTFDLARGARIVTAQIVNHPQHDPEQKPVDMKTKKSGCVVQ